MVKEAKSVEGKQKIQESLNEKETEFGKLYLQLSNDEKEIVDFIIDKFNTKGVDEKKQTIKNINETIQKYIDEVFHKTTKIGIIRSLNNSKINKFTKGNYNIILNTYNATTKGYYDRLINTKREKYFMQDEIEKSQDEDLKQINFPKRKVFNNKEDALKYIKTLQKNQKNFVIKPNNNANSKKVYLCSYNGGVIDIENLLSVQKNIHTIINDEYNMEKEKIIVEESILQENLHNIHEIVPIRFFCANGKCLLSVINYGGYKIEPFEERKKYSRSGVCLDKNMEEIDYEDKDNYMTREEKEKFKQIFCDKKTYQTMWRCAEKLSESLPNVRIDLFCAKQKDGTYKIYLNETQPNYTSTGAWLEFCGEKYLRKYNEMCNSMNFKNAEKETLQLGHIMRRNQIKKIREITNADNFGLISKKHKVDYKIISSNNLTLNKAKNKTKNIIEKANNFSLINKKNKTKNVIEKVEKEVNNMFKNNNKEYCGDLLLFNQKHKLPNIQRPTTANFMKTTNIITHKHLENYKVNAPKKLKLKTKKIIPIKIKHNINDIYKYQLGKLLHN